ncbi:hypothetical protein HDU98_001929 [Podochytrium sp. JEL0797]|nr:hypothetical protein HDU98_001929 [Podochytrium sp. JEL0797]
MEGFFEATKIKSKKKQNFGMAASSNLYLFRHMISGKVVTSGQFQLQPAQMVGLGTIRRDHVVPFAVVSFGSAEAQQRVLARLATPAPRLLAKGQRSLPFSAAKTAPRAALAKGVFGVRAAERADEWAPWTVPRHVASASIALCDALSAEDSAQATVRWERDEFRRAVDEVAKMWPENVRHESLVLFRNRYPVVPGLDRRTWTETAVAGQESAELA